jgi:hypothetical protein
VTSTKTTPAEYAIETCSEYLQASQNMCTVGRSIEVASQSRFQCAVTYEGTQTFNARAALARRCRTRHSRRAWGSRRGWRSRQTSFRRTRRSSRSVAPRQASP